jgi:hypothetical protein
VIHGPKDPQGRVLEIYTKLYIYMVNLVDTLQLPPIIAVLINMRYSTNTNFILICLFFQSQLAMYSEN